MRKEMACYVVDACRGGIDLVPEKAYRCQSTNKVAKYTPDRHFLKSYVKNPMRIKYQHKKRLTEL